MAKKKPNGPVEGSPFANMSVGAVVDAVQIAEAVQAVGRITTIGPNARSSMEPAPPPLPGPNIVLPAPEEAVKVLAELAVLNDKAAAALERYEDLRERTKTARGKYEQATKAVVILLRSATHASPLPLFDPVQREADQVAMEKAAEGALPMESAPEPESVF